MPLVCEDVCVQTHWCLLEMSPRGVRRPTAVSLLRARGSRGGGGAGRQGMGGRPASTSFPTAQAQPHSPTVLEFSPASLLPTPALGRLCCLEEGILFGVRGEGTELSFGAVGNIPMGFRIWVSPTDGAPQLLLSARLRPTGE